VPKKVGSTSAARAVRINAVVDMLINGARPHEIIEKVAKDYDLSDSSVEKDIRFARRQITDAAAVHHEHELGKALRRYELLFRNNMRVQDYKTALATQKELCTLLGLNAATKIEHGGSIEIDDARERIESRIAGIATRIGPEGSTQQPE